MLFPSFLLASASIAVPSCSLSSSALPTIISISPLHPFYSPCPVPFWLTSSLASILPFPVGSLEKLCALGGEHPFYTGPGRTRCVRGPLPRLSPRVDPCVYAVFFSTLPFPPRCRACARTPVHNGRNWRLAARMGVPRGRAKLIAVGTVSPIDRRWFAADRVPTRFSEREWKVCSRFSDWWCARYFFHRPWQYTLYVDLLRAVFGTTSVWEIETDRVEFRCAWRPRNIFRERGVWLGVWPSAATVACWRA